jgi:hypothetical protein
MITNPQTRTNVHEIADGIYRINTPIDADGRRVGIGRRSSAPTFAPFLRKLTPFAKAGQRAACDEYGAARFAVEVVK